MVGEGGAPVHGGMKVYRGSPTAARNYVEADRARADDYYLTEGAGVAERYTVTSSCGLGATRLSREGTLDGDAYESWVAGCDTAGAPKAVRFVEVVINGPRTWSLAAELHPEIARAYDEAQDRAAREIICWVAEHSTTRIDPRGRQVLVPVERIEAGSDPALRHAPVTRTVTCIPDQRPSLGRRTMAGTSTLSASGRPGGDQRHWPRRDPVRPAFRAASPRRYTMDTESGELISSPAT